MTQLHPLVPTHAVRSSSSSPPPPLLTDVAVLALSAFLLLFSLISVSIIVHFRVSLSVSSPTHRLRLFTSLWSVRVLLAAFACLWSLSELLRFPHLLHLIFSSSHLPKPVNLCRSYVILSHGFTEPCFFSTLLFLLQASLSSTSTTTIVKATQRQQPAGTASAITTRPFFSALLLSLATSLPFLLLHALFLSPFTSWALVRTGIPPEIFERVVGVMRSKADEEEQDESMRCVYPLFSTVLLAVFGAVYVPLFVSVCWKAVTVVINKRLRVRLYALAASVVAALSVQVAAYAFTAFWNPKDGVSQGLGMTGFVAVLVCALVGEGVLVVSPIRDAIEVGVWCSGGGRGGSRNCAAAVDGP